jgi:hypothetical protein
MPPFVAPVVEVEHVTRSGDVTEICIRGRLDPYKTALAPSALYDTRSERIEVAQFHRYLESIGERHTFQTLHGVTIPDSCIGQRYVFRPWHDQSELDIIADPSRTWTLRRYPDNGDHAHCLVSWETIAAFSDHKSGYESEGVWLTESGYKKYLIDDYYKIRKG